MTTDTAQIDKTPAWLQRLINACDPNNPNSKPNLLQQQQYGHLTLLQLLNMREAAHQAASGYSL